MKRRLTWREPVIALVSPLLTLVMVDRALTVVYPAFKVDGSRLIPDERLGWKLRPNHFSTLQGSRTNRLGFRGGEFSRSGPRPLTAFLGDSVTYSATTDDATFVRFFQERTGGRGYNFGVPGYGPMEYLKILDVVLEFEPDVVIIGFFLGNDVQNCREGRTASTWKNMTRNAREPTASWSWSGVYRLLLFRSVIELPGFGEGWNERESGETADAFNRMEYRRAVVFREGELAKEWACVERSLEEIARKRPDIVLMILPDEMQVNDDLWDTVMAKAGDPSEFSREYPNLRLREVASELGIRIVDTTPALRADPRRTFFRWDSHPNVLGNQIIAGTLYRELRQRYE